jgi:hypothetical protein
MNDACAAPSPLWLALLDRARLNVEIGLASGRIPRPSEVAAKVIDGCPTAAGAQLFRLKLECEVWAYLGFLRKQRALPPRRRRHRTVW